MIIYFTGTGNTGMAARLLAEKLGDTELRNIDTDMLLHPESHVVETSGERIIWAFPTYSWGIPPVVLNFIGNVALGHSARVARHYMLTTCGDDIGYADRQWRKAMKNRGLKAVSAFAVGMPNTYVCMKGFDVDSPQLEKKKLSDAPESIARIAAAILSNGNDILIRKSFSWIKTYIIYPWFKKYAMTAKPFHNTIACVSCGKCAESCPMANIKMTDGHPVWADNCALCLRCYHICPVHAVAYGNHTSDKGQYQYALTHKSFNQMK